MGATRLTVARIDMFIDMMELDALKPQQTSVMFLLCPFRVVSSHNEVSCSREEVERYHQSRGRCNNPIPGDVSIEMWPTLPQIILVSSDCIVHCIFPRFGV